MGVDHRCVLCEHTFELEAGDRRRCPRCLRSSGLQGQPTPPAPLTGLRWLAAGAAVLGADALAVATTDFSTMLPGERQGAAGTFLVLGLGGTALLAIGVLRRLRERR